MTSKASKIVEILETLRRCGGFYQCPKSTDGKRLGPLVGYAGKYQAKDGSFKQWVGDTYANFAKAEEYPFVLHYFAKQMQEKLAPVIGIIDVFCGAPLGGYDFAKMLGLVFDRRAIKAEKKVTALATATQREQSDVVFARHQPNPGERIAIVEDVCNNFSTTDQLIKLINQLGGGNSQVVAIICLLNRSLTVDSSYEPEERRPGQFILPIPVISLVRLPIKEYHQDDPEVAADIASGNVILKPKDQWAKLMAAMDAGNQRGGVNWQAGGQ